MSLLDKFTVTPLLYACGALLVACIALGGTVAWKSHTQATLQAKLDTALAKIDTASTERDAWKGRVDELAAANGAYTNALQVLRAELDKCQADKATVANQGKQAEAAARRAAADADAALQSFTAQFQQASHGGKCAVALAAMQQACPSLEGY